MRTLIIRTALSFCTVFTLGYTKAATPFTGPDNCEGKSRNDMERAVQHQMDRYIIYPLMEEGDMNGEVTVAFVIDTQGKVQVLQCTSSNTRLRDYVLRKLAAIDIGENPHGIWKTSHVRFVFGPEEV